MENESITTPKDMDSCANTTYRLASPIKKKHDSDVPMMGSPNSDNYCEVIEDLTPVEVVEEDGDEDYIEEEGEDEEEEEEYRWVYINNPTENAACSYCCNTITTSRYTVFTFLPKILFYEFSKLANAYFLIISVMQSIKAISNTGGFPASLPALSIIILIDMAFAAMEDYRRHTADKDSNETHVWRYDRGNMKFHQTNSESLQVGDIVKLHNREPVPADIVILGASEPDPLHPAGICYVETKSLDGETNLKLRQGLECTYTGIQDDSHLADIEGYIVCETPNNAIHRFCGSITLNDGTQETIGTNGVILRGCTIRNTDYVYGLVINTGNDTKIMMASSSIPVKWSNMETRLNKQILYICLLMAVLCLIGSTGATIWNLDNLPTKPHTKAWYLYRQNDIAVRKPAGNFFVIFLYYFLLLNSFIPVSLYVSMTSVKFMQAYFMNNDLQMYHEASDTPCQVRSMSLNEELGQVNYVFTDKTGTLTCNIMEFRKCSINGITYGIGDTEIGIAAKKRKGTYKEAQSSHDITVKASFVNYQGDSLLRDMQVHPNNKGAMSSASSKGSQKQKDIIALFWEHLAICHTVMPEKTSDGTLRLSASSPDEQALVSAAGCFGFRFAARSPGEATVEKFTMFGADDKYFSKEVYKVLDVLEFNSTRKRMSVIVQKPNGEIVLLCKGADTVIYERLKETSDESTLEIRDKTLLHMEEFASDGLRTLVLAYANLKEDSYRKWSKRFRAVSNDMQQIEKRRLGEANEIDKCMDEIEKDLEVIGSTAIEDKLQDGVPSTIYKLLQADIKVWMLTGDKEETAINIGFACQLLTNDIERIVISADSHSTLELIKSQLESCLKSSTDPSKFTSNSASPNLVLTPNSIHNGQTLSYSTDYSLVNVNELRNVNAKADNNSFANQSSNVPNTLNPSVLVLQESNSIKSSNNSGCDTQPNPSSNENEKVVTEYDQLALVIDGETLELALDHCSMLLLEVARRCCVVIACRVSPAQKAQLVELVKVNTPKARTLAIGDGANDVSMIQMAHIGVGISGQEGMQAANSSDYAIAQFRFLGRLLLVHGRWNYVRMATLILYIFYKNVMMNLTQFWYMFFTGFSGQKFFLEWGLQGYNLLFTALPIVLVGTLDQDVPDTLAMQFPRLYSIGQLDTRFNTKVVWRWILSCIWESLVICMFTLFGTNYMSEGTDSVDIWVYGCVAFTIVTLVVNLKLALYQHMWTFFHILVFVCSVGLWIITALVISKGSGNFQLYWLGTFKILGEHAFWLLLPLTVFTAIYRDILWRGYTRAFYPCYKHLVQEVHAFRLYKYADQLLAYPPPSTFPTTLETCIGTARSDEAQAASAITSAVGSQVDHKQRSQVGEAMGEISRQVTDAVEYAKRTVMRPFRDQNANTRGAAFSYDAESVMVQSFMSTEQYHNGHDITRSAFDRHASRGSLAFHEPDTTFDSLRAARNLPPRAVYRGTALGNVFDRGFNSSRAKSGRLNAMTSLQDDHTRYTLNASRRRVQKTQSENVLRVNQNSHRTIRREASAGRDINAINSDTVQQSVSRGDLRVRRYTMLGHH